MIFGLHEAGALARVSYHAQELSLLTSTTRIDLTELEQVKRELDLAFQQLLQTPEANELN